MHGYVWKFEVHYITKDRISLSQVNYMGPTLLCLSILMRWVLKYLAAHSYQYDFEVTLPRQHVGELAKEPGMQAIIKPCNLAQTRS